MFRLYRNWLNHIVTMGILFLLVSGCNKDEVVPVLSTLQISDIKQNTAICGGNITSDGNSNIRARGICWSSDTNPAIDASLTTDSIGTGSYASTMTGLSANTTYYVRAYATNNIGTAYGNCISFTTKSYEMFEAGVIDIDGNSYKTVVIGSQTWMAENLKVTHYRNGNVIPNITDKSEWKSYSSGAYCYYNNDISNSAIYGILYNCNAVNDKRTLAPAGWHVPTNSEWKVLTDFLGGANISGIKLKEEGTSHWRFNNYGVTNETGFTALPGGAKYNSIFSGLKEQGNWWYTNKESDGNAYFCYLDSYDYSVKFGATTEVVGFSVRCVKD